MTLIESYLYKKLEDVEIRYTEHSNLAQNITSTYGRASQDEIYRSMQDIMPTIIQVAKDIVKTNPTRGQFIVRDYSMGFDYQLFTNLSKKNKLIITMNTSIIHPEKLFNDRKNKVVNVDAFGDITMSELYKTRIGIIRKILNEVLKT